MSVRNTGTPRLLKAFTTRSADGLMSRVRISTVTLVLLVVGIFDLLRVVSRLHRQSPPSCARAEPSATSQQKYDL